MRYCVVMGLKASHLNVLGEILLCRGRKYCGKKKGEHDAKEFLLEVSQQRTFSAGRAQNLSPYKKR